MPEPREREEAVCGYCGDEFAVTKRWRIWCGAGCEFRGTWTAPAEHADFLEASTRAFVATVRIDPGYVIELADEGSRQATRGAGRRAA